VILLLPIALAACASSDDGRSITYTDDRGVANQPYPANYRAEILAFMRTYLNNPVGVRDAVMAEPVQRTVGGRLRYVSCLRFAARDSDGGYREGAQRRALCRWPARPPGRDAGEICAGATYTPFPNWKSWRGSGLELPPRARLPVILPRLRPGAIRSHFSEA
jgi:hypothetical protein